MLNHWTNKIQLRFWEELIDLMPRFQPVVKLVWSIFHSWLNIGLFKFVLKASAAAATGFLTGAVLYLLSSIL